MKNFLVPAIVLVALFSVYLFAAAKVTPIGISKSPPLVTKSAEDLLAIVANLKSTTIQITPGPVLGDLELIDRSFACAEGAPPDANVRAKSGVKFQFPIRDHQHAFASGQEVLISVFVTLNAQNVLGNDRIKFPSDTVILKQKLRKGKDHEVLLYTGMLKRESGYNPECGDWEFFTVSGDGKNLTSRGKLANCMDCHKEYPKSDFVTKVNYIVDPSEKP